MISSPSSQRSVSSNPSKTDAQEAQRSVAAANKVGQNAVSVAYKIDAP